MIFTVIFTFDLIEILTLIASIFNIIFELTVVYSSIIKKKRYRTITILILKTFSILLGLYNYFVFWFISCFLFIHLWFLFLKIKFSNEYDGIFLTNTLFLVICAFLAAVLLSQIPLHWIFAVFGIVLFAMLWLVPYIIYRRKALNFRKKAKKSYPYRIYAIRAQ